ncbi:hypothetical protein ACHAWF_008471 [Thalassiosira exigua]
MSSQLDLSFATSAYHEILILLQRGLPRTNRRLWYRAKDLESMIRERCLPSLPERFLSRALQSNQSNKSFLGVNRYQNKFWYCLEYDSSIPFDSPKDQILERVAMRTRGLNSELEKAFPDVPSDQFAGVEFYHLKEYRTSIHSDSGTTSAPGADRPRTGGQAARSPPPQPKSTNTPAVPTLCPPCAPAPVTPDNKPNGTRWKNGYKSELPLPKPGRPVGLAITSIGKISEAIKIAEEHAQQCYWKAPLEMTKIEKTGFETTETYGCVLCKKDYIIKSGPSHSGAKKKRGGQTSEISKILSHSSHASAVTPQQLQELCDQAGIVRPSNSTIGEMMKRRKKAVKWVANEQLRKNRLAHNAVIKERHGSDVNVVFKDSDGIEHILCCGPVSSDGGGETRAYNHHITGHQHVTVIYSCLIDAPLGMRHHQLSCYPCARTLTQLIASGKRAKDITEDDLRHEGQCNRNTKHSPAVAEEYAMEDLAEYLLIDPETGKMRPDDEAILAEYVVADGDTKGPKRFINKQAEIVPAFDNRAMHIPDIGHFIKCISGGLHKLAQQNSYLRGVNLLEAARIKTICSDVSGVLRWYGLKLKELSISKEPSDKAKLDEYRKEALARIKNIIPHHCGDHTNCSTNDCTMLKLERHVVCKFRAENSDSKLTRSEILDKHRGDITKAYVETSRFNGKVMSMGKSGQETCYKEISKRLDESNIDRVAATMTSNGCENFFGMLSKYSHGKRIFWGQSDSWEIFQFLVAGKKSDDHFEDAVQAYDGIVSSAVRDVNLARQVRKKQRDRLRQQTDAYKQRRKVRQYAKIKDVVKNKSASARHRSNKLSPKDSCTSQKPKVQKQSTRKRKPRCKNCQLAHSGPCIEPSYPESKKKKTTKKEKDEMEDLEEMYNVLYGN